MCLVGCSGGRGKQHGQGLYTLSLVSGLLTQLTPCAVHRILAWLDVARREFAHHLFGAVLVLPDDEHFRVRRDCHDQHVAEAVDHIVVDNVAAVATTDVLAHLQPGTGKHGRGFEDLPGLDFN
jgi:hypothetical protein